MFGDLIPKVNQPGPSLPDDPRTASAINRPVLNASSNSYGRGQSFPESPMPQRLPEEADPMGFERGIINAAAPTLKDQISTPSLADLLAGGGKNPRTITSQDRSGLQSRLKASVADQEGAPTLTDMFTSIMSGVEGGQFGNIQDAERYAVDPQNWMPEVAPTVTNAPGTMLSRLFGMDDGVPDAVEDMPTGRNTLRMPAGAPPDIAPDEALMQARAAIQSGKDPDAVRARLQEMGIDPNNL